MENEIIGYAVITPEGDLLNFDTIEAAVAAGHANPIPVIHVEEIVR